MLQQFQRLAGSLSRKQQILILAVGLAVAGGFYLLLRQQQEKDFRQLYTGLSAEDASQVVAKLKEGNVEYRLSDNGGTVLVKSARLAEVRLAEGRPAEGRPAEVPGPAGPGRPACYRAYR